MIRFYLTALVLLAAQPVEAKLCANLEARSFFVDGHREYTPFSFKGKELKIQYRHQPYRPMPGFREEVATLSRAFMTHYKGILTPESARQRLSQITGIPLGKYVSDGTFKVVFEWEGHPELLVKIYDMDLEKSDPEVSKWLEREMVMAELLPALGIPIAEIFPRIKPKDVSRLLQKGIIIQRRAEGIPIGHLLDEVTLKRAKRLHPQEYQAAEKLIAELQEINEQLVTWMDENDFDAVMGRYADDRAAIDVFRLTNVVCQNDKCVLYDW